MARFRYRQSTGELFFIALAGDLEESFRFAKGYAGAGLGKNNPAFQDVKNIGPIPQGKYTIGEFKKHPTRGPLVAELYPWKENKMFGRSAFLIHGDSAQHPGKASEGCLIFGLPIREILAESGVKTLEVVA